MAKRNSGNGQGSLFKRNGKGNWIAKYYDHEGKRIEKSTRTTDKQAAQRIRAKLVADAALRRDGVIDDTLDAMAKQSRRPIMEHLDDFKVALAAKGNSPRYVKLVYGRAKRVAEGCGFKTVSDLNASCVMEYLHGLREDVGKEQGISSQTFNFYLQAIKQFGTWMVKDRRIPSSPLAHLSGLNVKTDRRLERQAMTADQLRQLISTTESGNHQFGMTGEARGLLYRLAAETGFRAGELRSLTASSFRLTSDPPVVLVKAAYSKRRRDDLQALRTETCRLLVDHLHDKSPATKAFSMPSEFRLAKMLRADLAVAGIEAEDSEGRVIDFHALRHTFITNLVEGGVSPKTAQTLARHSTITLTMDRYTHQHVGNEIERIARFVFASR